MSSSKNNSKMSNNKYTRFSLLSIEETSDGEEPSFIIKNNTSETVEVNNLKEKKNLSIVKPDTNLQQSNLTTDSGNWTTVNKKPGKKIVKKVFKNPPEKPKEKKKIHYKKSHDNYDDSENESDEEPVTNNNEETENTINLQLDTNEYKFQNKWYIWIHEVDSKDWSTKSYKIVHAIENINDFWQFFNNINKLNQWKFNFFIMKASSHPTWEHTTNRNGGTCSIRIDISQSIDIIEQLAILLVNESLTEEINDINGISFAAKGNWCVIKIWNRDNKNNISNQMPSYLRKIYPAISIKYKENIPEY